jgi:hypothetical protein
LRLCIAHAQSGPNPRQLQKTMILTRDPGMTKVRILSRVKIKYFHPRRALDKKSYFSFHGLALTCLMFSVEKHGFTTTEYLDQKKVEEDAIFDLTKDCIFFSLFWLTNPAQMM